MRSSQDVLNVVYQRNSGKSRVSEAVGYLRALTDTVNGIQATAANGEQNWETQTANKPKGPPQGVDTCYANVTVANPGFRQR